MPQIVRTPGKPGRPHWNQPLTKKPVKAEQAPLTSWWIKEQSREQFMATAREESLKVKKRELILRHVGFGDTCL